jgi:hypothetical protein
MPCQEHSGLEQRVTTLEDGMKNLQKMLFWLVTSSFATLASIATGLIIVLVRK